MQKKIFSFLIILTLLFIGSSCKKKLSEQIAEDPENNGFSYEWEAYHFPTSPLRYVYSWEDYIGGHFYADEIEYCQMLVKNCTEDFFQLIQAAIEYAEGLKLEKCNISFSYIERYLLTFSFPEELMFSRCDPESEFYKLFISFSMKYGEIPFSHVDLRKSDGEWLVMFRIPETLAYRARVTEEDGYFSPYILLSTYFVCGDANKAGVALKTSGNTLYHLLETGSQTEKEFWLITDCNYSTGLTPPDDKNTVWKVHAGGDVYYDLEN